MAALTEENGLQVLDVTDLADLKAIADDVATVCKMDKIRLGTTTIDRDMRGLDPAGDPVHHRTSFMLGVLAGVALAEEELIP